MAYRRNGNKRILSLEKKIGTMQPEHKVDYHVY